MSNINLFNPYGLKLLNITPPISPKFSNYFNDLLIDSPQTATKNFDKSKTAKSGDISNILSRQKIRNMQNIPSPLTLDFIIPQKHQQRVNPTQKVQENLNDLGHKIDLKNTKLCVYHASGFCVHGKNCLYAHGNAQLVDQKFTGPIDAINNQNIYKTRLCNKYLKYNFCTKGKMCTFAHGIEELHVKNGNYGNYEKFTNLNSNFYFPPVASKDLVETGFKHPVSYNSVSENTTENLSKKNDEKIKVRAQNTRDNLPEDSTKYELANSIQNLEVEIYKYILETKTTPDWPNLLQDLTNYIKIYNFLSLDLEQLPKKDFSIGDVICLKSVKDKLQKDAKFIDKIENIKKLIFKEKNVNFFFLKKQ